MNFYKWLGVAVNALTVLLILRQLRPEFATLFALAASLLILTGVMSWILPSVQTVFQELTSIQGTYTKVLVKSLGIAILAQSGADLCRDAKETTLATKVELIGKAGIFAVSVPLLKELFHFAANLLTSS